MDLTTSQIKHMVDRFLEWRLPEGFNPDAGISFKRPPLKYSDDNGNLLPPAERGPPMPSGTNLFDAEQTEAMVRYMAEGMPPSPDFRWLTERHEGKEMSHQLTHTDAKEQIALWMMGHSYATGHGDTIDDMLEELVLQVARRAETDGYNKGVRDMAQGCPVCREAALPIPGSAESAEPVAWAERIGGKIVSVRLDKSIHCTEPLYAAPPAHG